MSAIGMLAAGAAINGINNIFSHMSSNYDREENYRLNEEAAENAYARQKEMYSMYYSPSALLKQYKEAGLSPSLMFGGTPGQGGTAAPMGAGAAGAITPFMPASLMEAAQVANINAETQKTKVETESINKDIALKQLEQNLQQFANNEKGIEFEILNSEWEDERTGKSTSLFEMAKKAYTYDAFLDDIRNNKDGIDNKRINQLTETEYGQRILRNIYIASNRLGRDIATLSEETVNAYFQIEVLKALESIDYTNENAQAVLQQLKTMTATNELTEAQKEAWNNIIRALGGKGSTAASIAIVLGEILGGFTKNTGIKLNIGGK